MDKNLSFLLSLNSRESQTPFLLQLSSMVQSDFGPCRQGFTENIVLDHFVPSQFPSLRKWHSIHPPLPIWLSPPLHTQSPVIGSRWRTEPQNWVALPHNGGEHVDGLLSFHKLWESSHLFTACMLPSLAHNWHETLSTFQTGMRNAKKG